MTAEDIERELRDELDKIQSKIKELEREIDELEKTVLENAQSANNIKNDF